MSKDRASACGSCGIVSCPSLCHHSLLQEDSTSHLHTVWACTDVHTLGHPFAFQTPQSSVGQRAIDKLLDGDVKGGSLILGPLESDFFN